MELNNYPFVEEDIAILAEQYGFDEECYATIEKKYELKEKKFPSILHIFFTNKSFEELYLNIMKPELVEMYKKRPGLFKDNKAKNSTLPQWLIAVPLYQQLQDWFREKHKINIYASGDGSMEKFAYCIEYNSKMYISKEDPLGQVQQYSPFKYEDYRTTLLEGFKKAFSLLPELKEEMEEKENENK